MTEWVFIALSWVMVCMHEGINGKEGRIWAVLVVKRSSLLAVWFPSCTLTVIVCVSFLGGVTLYWLPVNIWCKIRHSHSRSRIAWWQWVPHPVVAGYRGIVDSAQTALLSDCKVQHSHSWSRIAWWQWVPDPVVVGLPHCGIAGLWVLERSDMINFRQMYSHVKLNFKASLFSCIFWFEDSFICQFTYIYIY